MSRLATSFVLGYHGCNRKTGDRILSGETKLLKSDKNHDWLGPGIYFWESDPERAMEWARDRFDDPFVVGAAIDLGNCLDLMSRSDLALVKSAYGSFVEIQQKAGLEIPQNKSPAGSSDPDNLLRFLDCAVIRHLHAMSEQEPFDTVRGLFTEGPALYPSSGFREKTHVQIAVVREESIKGVFRVAPAES